MLGLGFWVWVGILKEKTQTVPFSLVLVFSGCAEMVCGVPSGSPGEVDGGRLVLSRCAFWTSLQRRIRASDFQGFTADPGCLSRPQPEGRVVKDQ